MRYLTSIFLLSLALSGASEPPGAPTDEDADRILAALKTALAGDDLPAKAEALRAAADCPHPRIIAALGKVLATDADDVRIGAARALGRMTGSADAARTLHAAVKPNEDSSRRVTEIFKAIATVGHSSSVAFCREWAKDCLHDEKRTVGATDAIDVLGVLRFRASVDALIEVAKKKKVAGGDPRYGFLTKCAVHAGLALKRLTGESFDTVDEWSDWWERNRNRYEDDMTPK